LDGVVDRITQPFCGKDFEEQDAVTASIEKFISIATHETAGTTKI